MTRSEAKKVIKRNNKARVELEKWNNACLKTSIMRPVFKIYQDRYEKAKKELADNVSQHKEALSVLFGSNNMV